MPTFVRLTDYKNSEEKEKGFFEEKNRYVANQEDFFKIPGSPIAYWVSDRVREIFEKSSGKLGEIAEPRQGMATSDNDRFLKLWYEVNIKNIGFGFENREEAKKSGLKWFPYNKGGEFQKWYGNQEFIVNWENDGYEIMNYAAMLYKNATRTIKNISYYFKEGITYSFVSSSKFAVRYTPKGFLFDVGGSSAFPKKEDLLYLVAFLNSNIAFDLLKIVAPTINFQVGDLKALPILKPKSSILKSKIDELTQECIDISKEEWDSRETSWDFRINELIRVKNEKLKVKSDVKLEDVYNAYCEYWREKFYKLHKNEEEFNRLFIEIYGLEDELTPDVPLEDITILKKEAKIENGKLVFDKKEIIKQFISYFVGVLFGRFSLDKEGLILANLGDDIDKYLQEITNSTFMPDDDNVVPILEREYFKDDIVSRFKKFVKVTFGEEYFDENIRFIEDAVGDIRKYFNKEFYKDHIRAYKKRPIYWMITSKNGSFKALIYMHRFYPDIFARVRNEYLLELIAKIESRIESLDKRLSGADTKEKKQIEKELVKLNKELKELYDFDKVLQKYANKTFEIDLDDGVKVNYCKFKEILYPISNLCK